MSKKKEELIGSRVPASLLKDIEHIEDAEQSDRSTVVRKLLSRAVSEWKKDYAAKQYAQGKIGLERAAADAGISVREMMDYIREHKISAQYDLEDLERDMNAFYQSKKK